MSAILYLSRIRCLYCANDVFIPYQYHYFIFGIDSFQFLHNFALSSLICKCAGNISISATTFFSLRPKRVTTYLFFF